MRRKGVRDLSGCYSMCLFMFVRMLDPGRAMGMGEVRSTGFPVA